MARATLGLLARSFAVGLALAHTCRTALVYWTSPEGTEPGGRFTATGTVSTTEPQPHHGHLHHAGSSR